MHKLELLSLSSVIVLDEGDMDKNTDDRYYISHSISKYIPRVIIKPGSVSIHESVRSQINDIKREFDSYIVSAGQYDTFAFEGTRFILTNEIDDRLKAYPTSCFARQYFDSEMFAISTLVDLELSDLPTIGKQFISSPINYASYDILQEGIKGVVRKRHIRSLGLHTDADLSVPFFIESNGAANYDINLGRGKFGGGIPPNMKYQINNPLLANNSRFFYGCFINSDLVEGRANNTVALKLTDLIASSASDICIEYEGADIIICLCQGYECMSIRVDDQSRMIKLKISNILSYVNSAKGVYLVIDGSQKLNKVEVK